MFVNDEYLVMLTISKPLEELKADLTELYRCGIALTVHVYYENLCDLYRAVELVPGARLSVYDIREHIPDTGSTKRQTPELVASYTHTPYHAIHKTWF